MVVHFNVNDENEVMSASLKVDPLELLLIRRALSGYFDDTKNPFIDRRGAWQMLLDYERAVAKLGNREEQEHE